MGFYVLLAIVVGGTIAAATGDPSAAVRGAIAFGVLGWLAFSFMRRI